LKQLYFQDLTALDAEYRASFHMDSFVLAIRLHTNYYKFIVSKCNLILFTREFPPYFHIYEGMYAIRLK